MPASGHSWRVPESKVPDVYPLVKVIERHNGIEDVSFERCSFRPKDRPDVASCIRHILVSDRRGGGHRHGSGLGKSEFPPIPDIDIMRLIDLTLAAPASIERWNSTLMFLRYEQGIPLTALVSARKPKPKLYTAYPDWDAFKRIRRGDDGLRWGL